MKFGQGYMLVTMGIFNVILAVYDTRIDMEDQVNQVNQVGWCNMT